MSGAAIHAAIHAIVMPKWGMAMDQGTVTAWLAAEGSSVATGQEIVEIESAKAAAAVEAKVAGVLRRVAEVGAVLPVGGLVGVIAESGASDQAVADYIAAHKDEIAATGAEQGPVPRLIEVGGRRLNCLDVGAGGEAVLLVHGFGGDLRGWGLVHDLLAGALRVVAFDLPGHGGSDPELGEGTPAALAALVPELATALGLKRVHLVGHSLGGAVAIAAAAAAGPGLIASLTLIASAGLGAEIDGGYIAGFLAAKRRRDLKEVVERLFADPAFVTGAMIEDILRMRRMDGVDEALRRLAARCFPDGRQAEFGLRAAFLGLPQPSQVIWGADDRIIPAAHVAGLAKATVLAGAGHMVQIERADEVARLILELARS